MVRTDRSGNFKFRTIKPGAYKIPGGQWRTPHIHLDVVSRNERIVTQMYFPGEKLNDTDLVLATADSKPSVISRAIEPLSGRPWRARLCLGHRTAERPDPFDRADRLRIAQGRDDRVQVRKVVHLDVEMERLEAAVAVDELKVDDVGVLGARGCLTLSRARRGCRVGSRRAAPRRHPSPRPRRGRASRRQCRLRACRSR